MDRENNLALISLFSFSSKIDQKINLKKSLLVGIKPEVKRFRNLKNPSESVLHILISNPRNCMIDGIELQSYCVEQHLKMRDVQNGELGNK